MRNSAFSSTCDRFYQHVYNFCQCSNWMLFTGLHDTFSDIRNLIERELQERDSRFRLDL